MKILLCGAFGYGNLGDNLIRDEAIRFFNGYFPEIEIYIDRPHPNDELIDYVDLRILGPGGLLYDSNDGHVEYFKKYAKPPFILLGTGCQYIEYIKEDGIVAECFKNADLIFQRHSRDIGIISQYRPNKENVFIIPDFGYFYNTNQKIKLFEKKKDKKLVCGCFNENTKHLLTDDIIKNIDIFISFHKDDDKFIDEISKKVNPNRTTIDYYFDSYEHSYSIIEQCDLLITSRFHAGILAKKNQKTKIAYLVEDNQKLGDGYKLDTEFKHRFDKDKFLYDKNKYIDSLEIETKISEKLDINDLNWYRDEIYEVFVMYFKDKFGLEF